MARQTIPQPIKNEINKYLQALKKDKLPLTKVVLFGSYAQGKPHRWSDIDLCIVSPRFKNAWQASQYLWSKRKITDIRYAIEPIGFSPTDFQDKYNLFSQEIKKNGIEIKI